MLRDGSHDLPPVTVAIDLVNVPECLVHVGHRGYERRSSPNRASDALPIEWVTPAVVLVFGAASFLKYFQEMECTAVVSLVIQMHRQHREAHCKMGVSYGKPLAFPEKLSSRRYEGLAEDDWSNRNRPKKRHPIVQSLDVPAELTRVKRLKVVRRLPVAVEPEDEAPHARQNASEKQTVCLGRQFLVDFGWYR